MRPLPMAAAGRPAPFRLGAPAYIVALGGWLVATVLLATSAPELSKAVVADDRIVAAAHAIGVVFFPFAVVAAAWQLLPVMLRNDPPRPGLRWLALAFLLAGVPLALGLATGREQLAWIAATLLAGGMILVLAEIVSLVRGAPAGRLLVVSRPAVGLAMANAVAAFGLGVIALVDGGPGPLGIPYERLLVVHLTLALVGWLTVMIMAVGRTLVPMLALAAALPPRKAPVPELVLVAGLWAFVVGIGSSNDRLGAAGVLVMATGIAPFARLGARSATARIGAREGPAAHVAVGLVFLTQAGTLVLAALGGAIDDRRTAVAAALLAGLGWAVGVIVGHLGKLLSLSGWGSWPPGPRPKQGALYPRRGWHLEIVLFALGVQALAAGVLTGSAHVARAGALVLAASALVALACAGETVRRVVSGRRQAGVGSTPRLRR